MRASLTSVSPVAVLVLVGGFMLAVPAPAVAATTTVATMAELQTALADCSTAPNTITLGADIAGPGVALTVPCTTTLDLSTFDLSARNLVIATGVEFTVTGPTDGTEGTLSVNSTGVSIIAGIRTTGATFTVTGGVVDVIGGYNGAAIGGDLTQNGGTLNVAGGTVTASASYYGAAIGGGYVGGAGGTVNVSGGHLNAISAGFYTTAIGGGGAGASGTGGAGATITVTGGLLTATAAANNSTAIGGGIAGLDNGDVGGAGGSLVVGPGGAVEISATTNAFGGGWNVLTGVRGDFGSLVVNGTLRLPSGTLYVGDDPVTVTELVVGTTGQILGQTGNPAVGASITGPGLISNLGAITLAPPAALVSGNNKLVSFSTGAPSVRVFAPSFTAGARVLPTPTAGTAWNTAADGSGTWFTTASSTAGSGSLALYAVQPATFSVSTDPADLVATAGDPFPFPVIVDGPSGSPLSPQPTVTYSSTDCTIVGASTFEVAGPCTITASTTVQGVNLQTSFGITVVAGAVDSLSIVPQAATVAQGASLSFTVEGSDEFGNPVDASGAVLTSSVATDVVTGHSVAFPHASPHTITATLAGVSAAVTIEVNPAAAAAALAAAGYDGNAGTLMILGALALLIIGGMLIVARRRAEQP